MPNTDYWVPERTEIPDTLAALGALARNESGWHLETDPKTFKELVTKAQLTVCAVVPDGRPLEAARRAADRDEQARIRGRKSRRG